MTTIGKSINEIKIGNSAQIVKTITEADIELFARATGDFNPVHLEAAYAEKTMQFSFLIQKNFTTVLLH